MSKTSYVNANLVSTYDTFANWLTKTNQIVYDMGTTVVTTSLSSTADVTTGNGFVNGQFGANVLYVANSLHGGIPSSLANLNITSNVVITSNTAIAANLLITGSANVQTNVNSVGIFSNNITVNNNITVTNTGTFTTAKALVANLTTANVVTLYVTNLADVVYLEADRIVATNVSSTYSNSTTMNTVTLSVTGTGTLATGVVTGNLSVTGNTALAQTNVTGNLQVSSVTTTANLTSNGTVSTNNFTSTNAVLTLANVTTANVTTLGVTGLATLTNVTFGTAAANVTANTTTIRVNSGTINVAINSSSITVANGSSSVSANAGTITLGTATINATFYSQTANNANNLGGRPASDYINITDNYIISGLHTYNSSLIVNAATLSVGNSTSNVIANSGTLYVGNTANNLSLNSSALIYNGTQLINSTSFAGTANNANNLGGVPAASYINTSGAYVITGIHTYNTTLIVNNATLSVGNSTSNVIANSGTLYVGNTANNLSLNSSAVIYNGTQLINSTSFAGTANNATNFGGQSYATVTGFITANASAAYTNAINYLTTNSYTVSNQVTFANITTFNANLIVNTATLSVGNNISNTTANTTVLRVANGSGSVTVSPTQISIGSATINSTIYSGTSQNTQAIVGKLVTGAPVTGFVLAYDAVTDQIRFTNPSNITTALDTNEIIANTSLSAGSNGSAFALVITGSPSSTSAAIRANTVTIGVDSGSILLNSNASVNTVLSVGRTATNVTINSTAVAVGANVIYSNGFFSGVTNNAIYLEGKSLGDLRAEIYGNAVTFVTTSVYSVGGIVTHNANLLVNNATLSVGNSTSNVIANSGSLFVGNSAANLIANSTAIVIGSATINSTFYSQTANNSNRLGGELPAFYRNATNINAGVLPWDHAAANTVNTTGQWSFTNTLTFSNTTTFNANISLTGSTTNLINIGGNTINSTVYTGSSDNLGGQPAARYVRNDISGTINGALTVNNNVLSVTNSNINISNSTANLVASIGSVVISNTTGSAANSLTLSRDTITLGNGSVNVSINSTAFTGEANSTVRIRGKTTDITGLSDGFTLYYELATDSFKFRSPGVLTAIEGETVTANTTLRAGNTGSGWVANIHGTSSTSNVNFVSNNISFTINSTNDIILSPRARATSNLFVGTVGGSSNVTISANTILVRDGSNTATVNASFFSRQANGAIYLGQEGSGKTLGDIESSIAAVNTFLLTNTYTSGANITFANTIAFTNTVTFNRNTTVSNGNFTVANGANVSTISTTSIAVANGSGTITITPTTLNPSINALSFGGATARWNITANTVDLTGAITSTAGATLAGSVVPNINAVALGTSTARWNITANTVDLTGAITSTAGATFAGSVLPNANNVALGAATARWNITANTGSYSGTITATDFVLANGATIWNSGARQGPGSGLNADLLDGQDGAWYADIPARLTYTPVQQGGGGSQGSNKIYIGWLNGTLGLQVDTSNFTNNWPINITGTATTATTATNATQLGGIPASSYRDASIINAGTFAFGRLPVLRIGTTQVQEGSTNQALTGISALSLPGSVGGTVTVQSISSGSNRTLLVPEFTGTASIVTTSDTGTVTSNMILNGTIENIDIATNAGIAISKLAASTISGISLGGNLGSLTAGSGLSGTAYNGGTAQTWSVDTSVVATISGSQVLSNKKINTRVTTINSNPSAAENLNVSPDSFDMYIINAQNTINIIPASGVASGSKLMFRIKDNGTSRTINWAGSIRQVGVILPTATTPNKIIYIGAIYNAENAQWDYVAVNIES